MPLPTIAIQNVSGVLLELPRLGLSVPAAGTLTLTDSLFVYEILSDEDLHDALDNGLATLTVDGVSLTGSALSPTNSTVDAFSAVDAIGGQQFTGTTVTVNLNVEVVASSSTYTLANNQAIVNEAGRYLVSYNVSLISTGGARTQGASFLEGNSTTLVPGTVGLLYLRQDQHGATASCTRPLDLSAGDSLRIRCLRVTGLGTLSTQQNGSSLSLVRIG